MRYTVSMQKRHLMLLSLLLCPFAASAASIHFGDYFLKGAEVAPDDVYVLGRTSTLSGKVNGDVVSISRSVFSQSEISGDVFLVGEEVKLEGRVGDDVRVVGGVVTIDGTVTDD